MKVFYEVKVLAVNPTEFENQEGETISYNEVHFLNINEDGKREVLKMNTKQEFLKYEDKEGVLEVDIDISGKNRPKLVSFKPNN